MTKVQFQLQESTGIEFGEILNVISGSSASLRFTKQLNFNGYIRAKKKGRVLQIMGNLPFELAKLVQNYKKIARNCT